MENLALFSKETLDTCSQPVDIAAEISQLAKTIQNDKYLVAYLSDLEIDKEIIKYDSQAGDQFIWVVKGTGAGTHMFYCGAAESTLLWRDHGSDSLYFHLSFVSIGKGYVKPVTQAMAQTLVENYKEKPNRTPRRYGHLAQFEKLLPGVDIKNSYLLSFLRTNPREEMQVKIHLQSSNMGYLTFVRTKLCPHNYECESSIKRVHMIGFTPSVELIQKIPVGTADYVNVRNTQQFYCEVEPSTARRFQYALKKWS